MEMDALRKRIKAAVEAKIVEYKELSEAIGRNHAYVQQFVTRGVPVEIKERHAEIIVGILDEREARKPTLIGSFDPDRPDETDFDPDWSEHSAASVDGRVVFDGAIPGSQPELTGKPGMGEGQLGDVRAARIVSKGIVTGHPVVNEWLVPHTFIRHQLGASPAGVVIMPVVGHSMEPLLRAHDRVMVDTSQNHFVGDAVYVIDDGDTIFQVKTVKKVLGSSPPMYRIVSEASPGEDDRPLRADEFRIVGKVVGRFTPM